MIVSPALKKQSVIYSDLRKDMLLNPVNSDVSRYTDEESVKESLRNLILTSNGERLFNPSIGSPIRKMLFDNVLYPETKFIIQDLISETIKNYEPRCELVSVDVTLGGSPDTSLESFNNTVSITVTFSLINIQRPITLSVLLNRVR